MNLTKIVLNENKPLSADANDEEIMAWTPYISEIVPLTDDEIVEFNAKEVAHDQLLTSLAAIKYKKDRANDYISVQDQLDMLWHAMDQGQMKMVSAFYHANQAVKLKYPKPTEGSQ